MHKLNKNAGILPKRNVFFLHKTSFKSDAPIYQILMIIYET